MISISGISACGNNETGDLISVILPTFNDYAYTLYKVGELT